VYGGALVSPIKLHDFVLIEGNFDKNRQHPWFQIVESEKFPTGIDWDNGMISTKRMGIKRESRYNWHFKSIKAIIDGRTNKAEDMIDRKDAMRRFREQVPELNWVEHMKP
jgi:hypothetical protein